MDWTNACHCGGCYAGQVGAVLAMTRDGPMTDQNAQPEHMAVMGFTYSYLMRTKYPDYGADVQRWVEELEPWSHEQLCHLTAHAMALLERVELADFDDYPAGREAGWRSFVADLDFILTEGVT